MIWRQCSLAALLMVSAAPFYAASAQSGPVLLRDSFPIGDGGGILCQVQDRSVENPAKQTIFDRSWAVVCRDSARPVANIYAFAENPADAAVLAAPMRPEPLDCSNSRSAPVAGITGAQATICLVAGTGLEWSIMQLQRGTTHFVAEGYAAYDDATVLALRSVLDNRIAAGTIDAASTSVADPLSFARVQADTLKPEQALAEGYRRNLGGEYAEAGAYFETLQQRYSDDPEVEINPGEFLINRALQSSNLGEFGIADRLFAEAAPLTAGDPLAGRLQRNFEAIHLLNQGDHAAAIARLGQELDLAVLGIAELEQGLAITMPLSARINQSGETGALLGFVDELRLTTEERAEIIDAQALQLRGTALRIEGRSAEARRDLLQAYVRAIAVRDGRVTSITRLRSQVLGDLSIIAERRGNFGQAESYLRNGLDVLEAQYPEWRAVSGAQARLASFLMRRGNEAEALGLYRGVIDRAVGRRSALTGFANQLAPYFSHLSSRVDSDPQAAEDFFRAMQVLVRPGVAETQAVLARELSANSDEASRLFRQSLDLTRDIERSRMRFQSLGRAEQTAAVQQERDELAVQIEMLELNQLRTQVLLNEFPQYRVVTPRALALDEFRAALVPGEAYARMAIIGNEVYVFYTDHQASRAYRAGASAVQLDDMVDFLRDSISVLEGGRSVTYPYEIETAHELYTALFGPVAGDLAGVDHLVFEPDGALLRLPIDILVADDVSVQTYLGRVADPAADPFDFTGVNWMARGRRISTAVSAQAFVDARNAPRSAAGREYLGMGNNTPVGDNPAPEIRAVIASGNDTCGWTAAAWNEPIDDAELRTARALVGENVSELMTGADFTDEAIMARDDLNDFRVLHFATHGLVTPPDPTCPAQPALLTSFGGTNSDGLLTFNEIFDLNLDADVVILSACDTAGAASIQATREAGITTGGGTALDGLVRAFIGAGGRAVMASHWPAPDDYGATQRLMDEMFRAGRTNSIGAALRQSQQLLMDDADTSHPYYWGGFAVIGDASRMLLSSQAESNDVAARDNASAPLAQ